MAKQQQRAEKRVGASGVCIHLCVYWWQWTQLPFSLSCFCSIPLFFVCGRRERHRHETNLSYLSLSSIYGVCVCVVDSSLFICFQEYNTQCVFFAMVTNYILLLSGLFERTKQRDCPSENRCKRKGLQGGASNNRPCCLGRVHPLSRHPIKRPTVPTAHGKLPQDPK